MIVQIIIAALIVAFSIFIIYKNIKKSAKGGCNCGGCSKSNCASRNMTNGSCNITLTKNDK
ncbi:FeoB-associated Cys-rich membrane protein [Clostridium thermobutyricum]|uniref:FeoB-associated Cys-rich membrane protein n=1 Tax=Clostridium thermobutyricum TaxID=29372 RepID=UPI0018A9EE1F|nr:FeoB-associated Cys-rich membrane protein [Clostridium thermobutyricum]